MKRRSWGRRHAAELLTLALLLLVLLVVAPLVVVAQDEPARGGQLADLVVERPAVTGGAHAERPQRRRFANQAVDTGRLRLDAVDHEEGGAFSRGEQQAVRMIEAAELAIVLGEVVVARGKTAR